MLSRYHRSTRYQKLDGSVPRYLALYESDTAVMGPEMKIILGTEWSKKIIEGAKVSNSDVWEYVSEFGKGASEELF